MNVEHSVEVLITHVLQRAATDVARVVNQNVDAPVVLEGGFDDRLAAFAGSNRRATRDGLTSGSGDLANHLLGRPRVDPVAIHGAANVVDDPFCPASGKQLRVRATQPAAGAGHHGNAVVESQLRRTGFAQAPSTSPSRL